MPARLAAGVIGLGMGSSHIRAYKEIGVDVRGICDIDAERLKRAGVEFGVPFATMSYVELVERRDIDVVSVCTPDHLHAEHCLAALENGKHVMCEKPMTTTLEDALAVVNCVRQKGLKLMVGNVNRFVPQFKLVKRLCEEGELGELFFVEGDYIHDMRRVYKATPWRIDPDRPQNAWLGGAVHPMDLVRWVAGDVEEIMLYSNKVKSAPEFPLHDNYVSILRFKGGCLGKVWETSGIRRVPEHVVNLNAYGSEGTVLANTLETEAKVYLNKGYEGQSGFTTIPFAETRGHPVAAELAYFADCILNDKEPMVNAVEGAKTIATLTAGLESAKLGRTVKVLNDF